MTDRAKAFFAVFRARYSGQVYTRAWTLLIIQASLIVLLCATIVLVYFVDIGERLVLYLSLTASLLLPLIISLVLNVRGRFKPAAWLTILTTMAGPWVCILADDAIAGGDYVPLIYLALSIQLCAILLSQRVTLIIGLLQFGGLTAVILAQPGLQSFNWPSLMAFIVFLGALGIVTSLMNRRQVEQIEKDRSLLKESEARMLELVARDSLTGLFNRRYMEETLDREISRAKREGRSLGVIMTDVDGFKQLNDAFGHALGDAVLASVAEVLDHNIRKSDVACRFGGDEFILILPECSLADTVMRAEALRRLVEAASFKLDGAEIGRVTMSMGVSALPEHGVIASDLLRAADKALYDAKRGGRNRVEAACAAAAGQIGL